MQEYLLANGRILAEYIQAEKRKESNIRIEEESIMEKKGKP